MPWSNNLSPPKVILPYPCAFIIVHLKPVLVFIHSFCSCSSLSIFFLFLLSVPNYLCTPSFLLIYVAKIMRLPPPPFIASLKICINTWNVLSTEICAISKISKKEIGRCFKLILKALETSVHLITTTDFMVSEIRFTCYLVTVNKSKSHEWLKF